jgi:hypothetical protein
MSKKPIRFIDRREETILEVVPAANVVRIFLANDGTLKTGGFVTLGKMTEEQMDRVFRIENLHEYDLEWIDFGHCRLIDCVENWPHRYEIFQRLVGFRVQMHALPAEFRAINKNSVELAAKLKTYFVSWKAVYRLLMENTIAMAPLELPQYVLLWTFDWIPGVGQHAEYKKVRLIEGVLQSRQSIIDKRT